MKLKHCYKYILYIVLISCIALLSINFTNNASNRIQHITNRIIINSPERVYIPPSKEHTENGGIRVLTPVTNGKSGAQLLPIPDPNSSIIVSPL